MEQSLSDHDRGGGERGAKIYASGRILIAFLLAANLVSMWYANLAGGRTHPAPAFPPTPHRTGAARDAEGQDRRGGVSDESTGFGGDEDSGQADPVASESEFRLWERETISAIGSHGDGAVRAVRPARKCARRDRPLPDGGGYGGGKKGEGSAGPKTLLAFVHVFKTAGTTLRNFFLDYASTCRAGTAILVKCTRVDPSTIGTVEISGDQHWDPCVLKGGVRRETGEPYGTGYTGRVTDALATRDSDILAGHFRLGTMDGLRDDRGESLDVRHVAFVRDAASKYVSGVLYREAAAAAIGSKKGGKRRGGWWEAESDAVVRRIKDNVNGLVGRGKFHCGYANYLLTPHQIREVESVRGRTGEDKARVQAEQVCKNLVDYDVVVGVVEHMSQSMELLRYVLDADREADEVFQSYGLGVEGDAGHTKKERRDNASPIATSEVMVHLREDKGFYKNLTLYVRYEQMITDFARGLHMQQYALFQNLLNHNVTSIP